MNMHAQFSAHLEGPRQAAHAPSLSAFAPGAVKPARDHARLAGMIGVLAVHGILLSLYFLVGMPPITRVIQHPVTVVMVPPELPKPLEPPPMPKFAAPVPFVPVLIVPDIVLETPPPPRETITLPPPQAVPSSPDGPLHAAPPAAPKPPVMSASSQKEFAARLFTHLNGYKRYPQAAKLRHQEGIVSLRFTMDRLGHVLSFAIAKSSGTPSLDEEARALLQRAQPLPVLPAEFTQTTLDLVVPVVFSLR